MDSMYAPPPDKRPEIVPPNRTPGRRPIVLWIVLILIFVAFFQFFSTETPAPRADQPPGPRIVAWPFLIPLATALALALSFWRIRARLPARYRDGVLRLGPIAPSSESNSTPSPIEPLELIGQSASRPIRLRIDEAGLHWTADARLLQPAQWLEIGWSELRGFGFGSQASGLFTAGLWLLIMGGCSSGFSLLVGVPLLAVGAVLAALGLRRRRWSLTFVTDTHRLAFLSRTLDEVTRERLLAAAKARRPELFPKTEAVTGWRALYMLLGKPFAMLGAVLQSDASAGAVVVGQATVVLDAETAAAGGLQRKLAGLWTGGFLGVLPLASGIAASLAWGTPVTFFVGYFGAWAVGLILSTRLMPTLARLSGMTLLK